MIMVPFYCGDGSGAILLEVSGIAEGYARGPNGTCAFCNGDPCAEDSKPGTHIADFFLRNPRAETCPCCGGRPT